MADYLQRFPHYGRNLAKRLAEAVDTADLSPKDNAPRSRCLKPSRRPALRPQLAAGPNLRSAPGWPRTPGYVHWALQAPAEIGRGQHGRSLDGRPDRGGQTHVALKLIKPGMDSGQVLARFEAERQALALMAHANIAKVLDAGTTAHARPYFVMELVKGIPITKYCDEHRLNLRERLDLFVPVCQAIQHAHLKGVIHRDIKPSNVLVADHEGKPTPKVIDFGIAKATWQPLTDQSIVTDLGMVIGTIEYIDPEQAQVNVQDIDTRSDVYSLGVLLYELLTGTTPLTRKRVKEAAPDEQLRLVRHEEASKPSKRSGSSEGLASIAAPRRMEPARLTKLHARRAGLDRHEGAGEGPHAALRDSQRPWAGHRALPP